LERPQPGPHGLVRRRAPIATTPPATINPTSAPVPAAINGCGNTASGIEYGGVSVKAKTSEGMGYTGDGTGIAAYAVATLHPVSDRSDS